MNIFRSNLGHTIRKMSSGPIQTKMEICLTRELNPSYLEIKNESYMHGVPKDSETHFKVLVVSKKFDGLSLIHRHRMVNNCLKNDLKTEFPHALSIVAKNLDEYDEKYKLEPSPNCRGGFGKIDVFKEKPVYNSLFRRLFLRGDIPCHRSFEKYQEDGWTKEKFLKWKVESPQDLDYCYYLPIFFDGLCEKEFPYNMIARHAIHDLLNAGSNKILPVIRKLIMPIKYALGTKNCDVILATLRIIQHMCICDCNVAEALVPYFRQILPILNMYIGCNLNISDRIDYDRVGNISNVIEETLSILEHYGGPDAFINIKYCIPSYESYVNN